MQLLTTMLDWCFPPRPEQLIVRHLSRADIVLQPRYPNRHTVSLLPFHQTIVHALIHETKFVYNQRAHTLLGAVVGAYLTEQFPTAVLVPIPLHPKRERKRGFNQVTTCLRSYPTLRSRINQRLLYRQRHTKPQTTMTGAERAKNVVDAFAVRPHVAARIAPGTQLLLIDDVYTTGATLRAARTAVRAAVPQATISCLTFTYA